MCYPLPEALLLMEMGLELDLALEQDRAHQVHAFLVGTAYIVLTLNLLANQPGGGAGHGDVGMNSCGPAAGTVT